MPAKFSQLLAILGKFAKHLFIQSPSPTSSQKLTGLISMDHINGSDQFAKLPEIMFVPLKPVSPVGGRGNIAHQKENYWRNLCFPDLR